MVELSAHASNQRPALKNEVYRVPTPGVVLETPEVSRDGPSVAGRRRGARWASSRRKPEGGA